MVTQSGLVLLHFHLTTKSLRVVVPKEKSNFGRCRIGRLSGNVKTCHQFQTLIFHMMEKGLPVQEIRLLFGMSEMEGGLHPFQTMLDGLWRQLFPLMEQPS